MSRACVKPARRRPQARQDILENARYYRQTAGAEIAGRFARAVKQAIEQLEANPAIGSPRLGQDIEVPGLRTWRLMGFPAAVWYFERADHVDVVRLVGERQDPELIGLPDGDVTTGG